MPVTKTAKRALRSSKRKEKRNAKQIANLEVAIRQSAKGTQKAKAVAQSLIDRAVKKGLIHKNKAARLKGALSRTVKKSKGAK